MSVGRPLQFDPDRALEAAMHLFWRRGYESTSLQHLLEAMGLSKSSFYQAFGNKSSLYRRCLSHYRDITIGSLQEALTDQYNAWDIIQSLFYCTIEEAFDKEHHWGCMVMNAATEFAQRDLSVAAEVSATTQAFTDAFTVILRRAQHQGDIAPHHNPEQVAQYLLTSLSGLHTMLKAGTPRHTAESVVAMTLSALKSTPSLN